MKGYGLITDFRYVKCGDVFVHDKVEYLCVANVLDKVTDKYMIVTTNRENPLDVVKVFRLINADVMVDVIFRVEIKLIVEEVHER